MAREGSTRSILQFFGARSTSWSFVPSSTGYIADKTCAPCPCHRDRSRVSAASRAQSSTELLLRNIRYLRACDNLVSDRLKCGKESRREGGAKLIALLHKCNFVHIRQNLESPTRWCDQYRSESASPVIMTRAPPRMRTCNIPITLLRRTYGKSANRCG